jgi:hypothetical protein
MCCYSVSTRVNHVANDDMPHESTCKILVTGKVVAAALCCDITRLIRGCGGGDVVKRSAFQPQWAGLRTDAGLTPDCSP